MSAPRRLAPFGFGARRTTFGARTWSGESRSGERVPRIERICYVIAGLLAVSGVAFLAVATLGSRPWAGPVSWRKPATFGLSFGLTLATVTWVASYLTVSRRERTWLLGVFAADSVIEVAGVTLQAVRHVPSHLNRSTPLNMVIALTLAAGGAVLIIVLGRLAFVAFAGRMDAPPSMRLALRAGFALLLVGLLSGAAMIARGTVAMNTGTAAYAYAATGFLKDVHGVTLHAILVLPGYAWWLARGELAEPARTRRVAALTAAYVAAAAVLLAIELIRAV